MKSVMYKLRLPSCYGSHIHDATTTKCTSYYHDLSAFTWSIYNNQRLFTLWAIEGD